MLSDGQRHKRNSASYCKYNIKFTSISHIMHIHLHKQHLGSSDSQSIGYFWFKTEISRVVEVYLVALSVP